MGMMFALINHPEIYLQLISPILPGSSVAAHSHCLRWNKCAKAEHGLLMHRVLFAGNINNEPYILESLCTVAISPQFWEVTQNCCFKVCLRVLWQNMLFTGRTPIQKSVIPSDARWFLIRQKTKNWKENNRKNGNEQINNSRKSLMLSKNSKTTKKAECRITLLASKYANI